MAQYTITYGCGHTASRQLYGPGKERDRHLEWARSPQGKCNACYARLKRQEQQEAHADKVASIYTQMEVEVAARLAKGEPLHNIMLEAIEGVAKATEMGRRPEQYPALEAAVQWLGAQGHETLEEESHA